LPSLLAAGHSVVALVRDRRRFPERDFEKVGDRFQLLEGDLLEPHSLPPLPDDISGAYFLVHSMGGGGNFAERELVAARNFIEWLDGGSCRRIVYLGGLGSGGGELSKHLKSRRGVERVLGEGKAELTVLRASIIVGSGSASFEIIRDLAEKLPIMICPRWVNTRCQPIAIRNVIQYLTAVWSDPATAGQTYDIGGDEVLSYRDLLEGYAEVRGLKRQFLPVPFLSPRLSSWWLYLMTSTRFSLAQALVDSMKNETVCGEFQIRERLPLELCSYAQSVDLALSRIAQNRVPSSWIDSLVGGSLDARFIDAIKVPEHGVYSDRQEVELRVSRDEVVEAVWSLGGENGWPSMNWAWELRGWLSRLTGGIGTRRGRRDPRWLRAGDALDFWRVVLADEEAGRLILYAEMNLPGEAWLDFQVSEDGLIQTATFRPQGLLGRAYWIAVLPVHWILFPRMAQALAGGFPESRIRG
ncbi:MAG: SDR family oxidoreductase, partial [Verrucomicrobiales bacterium]